MKAKKEPISKLSMSLPAEMKPLIQARAEALDLTVSQWIRKLVAADLENPKAGEQNTEL